MSDQMLRYSDKHTIALPVSIKKLNNPGIIKLAAAHNLRELANEIGAAGHIDPDRTHANIVLRGAADSAGVAEYARALMASAGLRTVRKDAVLGLELLFTLPPSATVAIREYFEAATAWASSHFHVPVLSSVVHLDESVPHCHVLLLPLVAGKMNGSRLFGARTKLRCMHDSFDQHVLSPFGLIGPARRPRLSLVQRRQGIAAARAKLVTHSALSESLIDELLKPHVSNPDPLLAQLNIEIPQLRQPRTRSFVEIMTRPVRVDRSKPTYVGSASCFSRAGSPVVSAKPILV